MKSRNLDVEGTSFGLILHADGMRLSRLALFAAAKGSQFVILAVDRKNWNVFWYRSVR